MLGRILNAKFLPTNQDVQLLVLRVGTGLTLFFRHGLEKVVPFRLTDPHGPDPLHLGHTPTWIIQLLSDVVCALLITLGVGTRWLAAFCFANIFVAFALVHHFTFTGKSPDADHGELIVQYLIALTALMIGGPGRYSIDGMLADK